MKFYISFGSQSHEIRGQVFDSMTLCEIQAENMEEARSKAFEEFGNQWSTVYSYGPRILKKIDKWGYKIAKLPKNRWEILHMGKWIAVPGDVASACIDLQPNTILRLA